MHKRTTPKIFGRARELHRNRSDAELKLWKHLHAHRMGDVHFRSQQVQNLFPHPDFAKMER